MTLPSSIGRDSASRLQVKVNLLHDAKHPFFEQIPAPINQYLRPYQREGVEFLYRNYIAGRKEEKVKKKEGERRKGKSVGGKGALLCDDMGLGKTIQVKR